MLWTDFLCSNFSNLYFGISPLNRMVVGVVAYGKNLAITIEVTWDWFCRKSWEGLASLYFSLCEYTERRWLPINQESIRARTGVFCWHLDLEFLSLQTCRKIILLVHLLSENMLAFWILPSIKYKMPFTGSCLHTRTPAELLLWEVQDLWGDEMQPT